MMKKIVRYSSVLVPPVVGKSAVVLPVDHPDTDRVSNRNFVKTSEVVRVEAYPDEGEFDEFETLNTVYRRA